MEEATTMLLASDQIDHESIQNTEYGIASNGIRVQQIHLIHGLGSMPVTMA
jgi:hypothetical protein